MRSLPFVLLFATVAVSFTACTGPRYASSSEYDDVYFTKADIAAPVAVNNYQEDSYDQEPRTFQREPVDSYRDYYYGDDDFTFSRRVRRFNQSNRDSWRYFDPYYSNDLYYVINSPSWNSWNSNGWYNWNSPRFGSYYNAYNDPFAFRNNPYRSWGALNRYSSFSYDPFVGAYYGYSPFGASNFYSPFNSPFGYSSFGSGFGYGGFGSAAYYCPPIGVSPAGSFWNRGLNANRNVGQSYVTTRRNTESTTGNRTSSRTRINNTRPAATPSSNRVASSSSRNSNYLQPRTRTASSARPATTRPGRTAATNRTNAGTSRRATTNTGRSARTYTRSNRTVTNGSSNRSRYNTNSGSSRNYSAPRTNNSNRTFSSPSRRSNTFSSPSMNRSNSSGSFNRSSTGSSSRSSGRSSSGVRRR
ncbi:MAG: hypothetical protein AAF587_43130 [Bacteroidota bacterium]